MLETGLKGVRWPPWRVVVAFVAAVGMALGAAGCHPQSMAESDATSTPVEAGATPMPMEADPTRPPVEVLVTRPPVEIDGTGTICAPEWDRPAWLFREFVQWSPDGSTVLFTDGSNIFAVAANGSSLWNVVAPKPPESQRGWPMAPFSISPDGKHVVYATCDFGGFYELARVRLDGTGVQRVTRSPGSFDSHPAWSPDGARIAFLAADFDVDGSTGNYPSGIRPRLYTLAPDGTDRAEVPVGRVDRFTHLRLHRPQWSPDGRHLAFVKQDGSSAHNYIYTYALGATNSQRLSDAVSGPSWSPDGGRLAFAKPDGAEVALFTMAADGTDAQRVATVAGWHPEYGDPNPIQAWIESVAWSPDGSKILYTCGRSVCVVTLTATLAVTKLPVEGVLAAWSPDGLRIALLDDGPVLYSVTSDGSYVQLLAAYPEDDGFQAQEPRRPVGPVDVAGCAAGTAVPKPADNPGLVQDCETLLVVQAKLAGVGGLGWTTDRPLKEWDGVFLGDPRLGVYRPPLRVRRLMLSERGLRGEIPPELAQLTQLAWLVLTGNELDGEIPPELGALVELQHLNLRWNGLSGAIPAELGALRELKSLDLFGNQLTAAIPPDLRNLTRLRWLFLGENWLTGCIPPALHRVPDNDLAKLGLADCEPG